MSQGAQGLELIFGGVAPTQMDPAFEQLLEGASDMYYTMCAKAALLFRMVSDGKSDEIDDEAREKALPTTTRAFGANAARLEPAMMDAYGPDDLALEAVRQQLRTVIKRLPQSHYYSAKEFDRPKDYRTWLDITTKRLKKRLIRLEAQAIIAERESKKGKKKDKGKSKSGSKRGKKGEKPGFFARLFGCVSGPPDEIIIDDDDAARPAARRNSANDDIVDEARRRVEEDLEGKKAGKGGGRDDELDFHLGYRLCLWMFMRYCALVAQARAKRMEETANKSEKKKGTLLDRSAEFNARMAALAGKDDEGVEAPLGVETALINTAPAEDEKLSFMQFKDLVAPTDPMKAALEAWAGVYGVGEVYCALEMLQLLAWNLSASKAFFEEVRGGSGGDEDSAQ
jgi:hypothetical protein